MTRVLIIEEDPSIVLGLTTALENEGYAVEVGRTGPDGLQLAIDWHPDLILLDLMLPGMSGFEICKRIRDRNIPAKIIMLTSRAEEDDRVLGLELGADDYVTKPFSLRELLARLRAHLRSGDAQALQGASQPPTEFRFGEILVDFRRHELRRANRPEPVTSREFRLLEYLIRHPGEVVSRSQLLDEVWDHDLGQTTRTVDNHILRLRKHIEPDPENPRYIRTVRGAGYLFDPEPQTRAEPV